MADTTQRTETMIERLWKVLDPDAGTSTGTTLERLGDGGTVIGPQTVTFKVLLSGTQQMRALRAMRDLLRRTPVMAQVLDGGAKEIRISEVLGSLGDEASESFINDFARTVLGKQIEVLALGAGENFLDRFELEEAIKVLGPFFGRLLRALRAQKTGSPESAQTP